jgi:hypothetical protein
MSPLEAHQISILHMEELRRRAARRHHAPRLPATSPTSGRVRGILRRLPAGARRHRAPVTATRP